MPGVPHQLDGHPKAAGGFLSRDVQYSFHLSSAQAHTILAKTGINPVHKMMDLAASVLDGVCRLCALNAGHDMPVSEPRF